MLMSVAKPTYMPAWSETLPSLMQTQQLNGIAVVDFAARTLTVHSEFFGADLVPPSQTGNQTPFRRFKANQISRPYRDVSSQEGVILGVHSLQWDAVLINGSTLTVEWIVSPTNGGNTMLVLGTTANSDGDSYATGVPGIQNFSGVCQMQ